MSVKELLDAAAATTVAADQLAEAASLKTLEAAAAVDELKDIFADVPKTAQEVMRKCVNSECHAQVRHEIDTYVVASAALDFKVFMRRKSAQELAHHIAQKLPLQFASFESSLRCMRDVAVYKGELFVFTRAELLQYTQTAVAAGRFQS